MLLAQRERRFDLIRPDEVRQAREEQDEWQSRQSEGAEQEEEPEVHRVRDPRHALSLAHVGRVEVVELVTGDRVLMRLRALAVEQTLLEDAWIPVARDVHAAQPENCDATHREGDYHDSDKEQRVEEDALPFEVGVEDQARIALSLRARRTAWERARVANLCAVLMNDV